MDEMIFEGSGWTLRRVTAQLPDGRTKKSIRATLPPTAHILAFPKPGKVILLREYRPFYGRYLWMIPSGKIDKETNVPEGAMRELREETGYVADEFMEYGTFRNIESVDYVCHLFIARQLRRDPLPPDEDEMIEVHELPLEEAIDKVLGDPPMHTMSVAALLKYYKEFGSK